MNVAIVGCGLIGQKRARALAGARLVACADSSLARAQQLTHIAEGSEANSDWQSVVRRDDVDVVIIAVPHHALAEICRGAIEAGKHVLVEKPAARHVGELQLLVAMADKKGVLVHVGFAISIIDEVEAQEVFEYLRQMNELAELEEAQ